MSSFPFKISLPTVNYNKEDLLKKCQVNTWLLMEILANTEVELVTFLQQHDTLSLLTILTPFIHIVKMRLWLTSEFTTSL